jgi:hypothetical protein
MEMLELYGQMKLKGQRASKKILKEGTSTLTSKLCLPYSKLRCLRGELTNQEIVEMLTTVVHLEMSVTDLEKELCRINDAIFAKFRGAGSHLKRRGQPFKKGIFF